MQARTVLTRIRGLFGVGASWGLLWGAIGGMIGAVIGTVTGVPLGDPVVEWMLGMGAYGLVSGIGFGTLLSLGEGSRTLRDLSLQRVALWGILGSAMVPLGFGALGFFEVGTTIRDVLGAMAVTASLGGTFASGSVAIARRAELAEPASTPRLES
ncbi:MAG: hypothetical protein OEN56_12150 [Gemmatimonadota bacterium]|nr:hypothetical protein [Gemmatimonadota bacterium]MDH3423214.1 hypothetical protein [Gemmatimonadota bacterium]